MSKKEELKDIGLNFYNCDPHADGKPLCRLGMTADNYYAPKTIQLKGACAAEILRKQRNLDPGERKYEVMLIGEAPGRTEDNLGIPFVGDAGDILADFLSSSGFDLDKVYITNLVKCRPPKNRNPAIKEIQACLTHVYHEIRSIQPKVIMLLGRVPLRLFNLDKLGGIGKTRGKLYEKPLPHWEDGPEFKIIPTYHPASFIYRPDEKLKNRVRSDFKFAASLIKHDNISDVPVYICDHTIADTVEKVKDMVRQVKQAKIFAWDTESPDLHFKDSPMRTLQVSIGLGKTWVIPFYKHDPDALGKWKMVPHFQNGERTAVTEELRTIFEDETITQVAHNAKYDINVVKRWLGVETRGWVWDTAAMHHLLYEYPPHDLEYLSDVEFGIGDYSFQIREIVGHGKDLRKTYDHIPDEILWPYGANDAECTFRLMEVYKEALQKKPHLMKVYEEETHDLIFSLQEAEEYGNKIIYKNVDELEDHLVKELDDLLTKCRQYTWPDFNPMSTPQTQEAFKKLGYIKQITAPAKPSGFSTAKDILLELPHPLAQHLIDYRNRRKMLSTYVNRVSEDIDSDGRVRYGFNMTGTVNGRLSCRLLHQMPRIDKEKIEQAQAVLRSIFGEEDNFIYFYADYSQIELRVFAYLTGEAELIRILEANGDIHAATAAAALGTTIRQVSDFNRSNVGKRLNFGVIYGSEGHQVARGEFENPRTGKRETIGKRAFDFVKNFRERYKMVDEYLTRVPEDALCNGGVIKMVFGRERRIQGLNDADEYRRGHAEREATNATIQGPAGAITLRTINLVRHMLRQNGIGPDQIRFLNTVHDSVSYGVHKDLVDWFSQEFKTVAERPIPEIQGKSFPIKWGVGKTWTEAELSAG